MTEAEIINRLHCSGIEELKSVTSLNELSGDYVNLECRWPNGATGKILNDSTKYLAAQIEREEDDRCYGVAADDKQIAVYSYGCKGRDAELVLWIKL